MRHGRWTMVQGTTGSCASQANWDQKTLQFKLVRLRPLNTMWWPRCYWSCWGRLNKERVSAGQSACIINLFQISQLVTKMIPNAWGKTRPPIRFQFTVDFVLKSEFQLSLQQTVHRTEAPGRIQATRTWKRGTSKEKRLQKKVKLK